VLLTKVGVQQRALAAYWRWVAAGQQLAVYENLLAIALEREEGSRARGEQRPSGGDLHHGEPPEHHPPPDPGDGLAARFSRIAANQLAFYLRGNDGEPLEPARQRLPAEAQIDALPAVPQAAPSM
jgi:hypothetical protein